MSNFWNPNFPSSNPLNRAFANSPMQGGGYGFFSTQSPKDTAPPTQASPYLSNPNSNLGLNSTSDSGGGGGGGGGGVPTDIASRLREIAQECAQYVQGTPQRANCEERLATLLKEKNEQDKMLGESGTPKPGTPGQPSQPGQPSAAIPAPPQTGDPDLDELERLHRLHTATSDPSMKSRIWARILEVHSHIEMRKRQQERDDRHRELQGQADRAAQRQQDADKDRFMRWYLQTHPGTTSRDAEAAWGQGKPDNTLLGEYERFKKASAIQAASAPQPMDAVAQRNFDATVHSDSDNVVTPATREQIYGGDVNAARQEAAQRAAQSQDPAYQRTQQQVQQLRAMMKNMNISPETQQKLEQLVSNGMSVVEAMNFLTQVGQRGGNADALARGVIDKAGGKLAEASDPNRDQRLAAALANGRITPEQFQRYLYNEEPLPPGL